MNRHSRKLLKYLRKSNPDFDNRVYTYVFLEENYNEPIESVFATVRYLSKEDYLEIAKTNGTHFGVILTEKGLHPYEFTWETVKSFLITSVAVPLIVSFLTAVVTTVVGYLWSTSVINQNTNNIPDAKPTIEETVMQTTDKAD